MYITQRELRVLLIDNISDLISWNFNLKIYKPQYYLPVLEDIIPIVDSYVLNRKEYFRYQYNCASFSRALSADIHEQNFKIEEDGSVTRRPPIACGVLDGMSTARQEGHSVNFVMLQDRFIFIEPQLVNKGLTKGVYPSDKPILEQIHLAELW